MIFKRLSSVLLAASLAAGSFADCFAEERGKAQADGAAVVNIEDAALDALSSVPLGNGTEDDPFIAYDEDSFWLIVDFPDAYWEVSDDIVFTRDWEPVEEFTGNLNGNGHTISGINFTGSGFFEYNTGTIKNLSLEGSQTYDDDAAFFVYCNTGTIDGCSAKGTMVLIRDSSYGTAHCAGFAVTNHRYTSSTNYYGTIQNCYSRIAFTYNGNNTDKLVTTGGFIQAADGTITNCYSACSLTNPDNNSFYGFSNYSYYNRNVSGCFYNKNLDGVEESSYGEGKSTTAMKMKNTYTNWDFDNIWAIDTTGVINDGYPYFKMSETSSGSSSDPSSGTASTGLLGDVDGDGILTASDAAYVLQKVLDNDFIFPVEK